MIKLWIYLVTWCSITQVAAPPETTTDEWGRTYINTNPVYHYKTITKCGNKKVFTNRKEAHEFYDLSLRQVSPIVYGFGGGLKDVTIDSIQIQVSDTSKLKLFLIPK